MDRDEILWYLRIDWLPFCGRQGCPRASCGGQTTVSHSSQKGPQRALNYEQRIHPLSLRVPGVIACSTLRGPTLSRFHVHWNRLLSCRLIAELRDFRGISPGTTWTAYFSELLRIRLRTHRRIALAIYRVFSKSF